MAGFIRPKSVREAEAVKGSGGVADKPMTGLTRRQNYKILLKFASKTK